MEEAYASTRGLGQDGLYLDQWDGLIYQVLMLMNAIDGSTDVTILSCFPSRIQDSVMKHEMILTRGNTWECRSRLKCYYTWIA